LITTEVLDRLTAVRKSGRGWTAQCPAHEDKQPSLSITETDGKILLHCFAGCTPENICTALDIRLSDLFLNGNHSAGRPLDTNPSKPDKPTFNATDKDVETLLYNLTQSAACREFIEGRGISLTAAADLHWGYSPSWSFEEKNDRRVQRPALMIPHYADGKLVGIKARTISGKKLLSQELGSSTDGLYGQPDMSCEEVIVLEGFLDCALAMTHGFNVTALHSATAKITDHDIKTLSSFERIYLVGDMNIPGQRKIDELQKKLPVEQVIRVRIPGFTDIGEMYAAAPEKFKTNFTHALRFARASRDPFELDDLLTEIEIRAGMQGIQPHIVESIAPKNCITMLFGEEKSGKSSLATYIGKCVANGARVFGKYATVKTPVLYLDLENSNAEIEFFTRLFARIGPEPIRYRTRITGCPALDSPGLLRFCEKYKPLLITDSLTKHSGNADPFNPKEMSQFFDMLLNLCAAGATIILIHHSTKDDVERYANSHQIGAAVSRAFAIVSEDRPRLQRVRMEGKLFRAAEPFSVNLMAFPVILDTGHFGLADTTETPIDRLVEFVRKKGGQCPAEDIKTRKGIRRERSTDELNQAVKEGRLTWKKRGPVSVPERGNEANEIIPFPTTGTDGTEGEPDDANAL
jgi:putative DNA primase/helicase